MLCLYKVLDMFTKNFFFKYFYLACIYRVIHQSVDKYFM